MSQRARMHLHSGDADLGNLLAGALDKAKPCREGLPVRALALCHPGAPDAAPRSAHCAIKVRLRMLLCVNVSIR